MPASLSLAGVLLVGVGGFVVATTYDHRNRLQRTAGWVIGAGLILLGIGLFLAGIV